MEFRARPGSARAGANHRASCCPSAGELCEGLIRPTTFGVTGNWVDEYGWPAVGNPPRWNWFLKTPQSPPDARSPYVDPQVMETATLDERSMLAAICCTPTTAHTD